MGEWWCPAELDGFEFLEWGVRSGGGRSGVPIFQERARRLPLSAPFKSFSIAGHVHSQLNKSTILVSKTTNPTASMYPRATSPFTLRMSSGSTGRRGSPMVGFSTNCPK